MVKDEWNYRDRKKVNDEVLLLGDLYNADDLAMDIGTVRYEIICSISKSVPRVYIYLKDDMVRMKNGKACLITLPHAGGSSTIFKGWDRKLDCDVYNIEYPGHWTRMKEELISSFDNLVTDVVPKIEENVGCESELLMFGHSLGAIMAWQIAPILINKGYTLKKLFFSGSQNPGSFPEKSIVEASSDIDMLKLIGYNAEEHDAMINDQFMKNFFPILKNDMEVCKSFICDHHYVNVESIVLYGSDDIFTDLSAMEKWGKYANVSKMIKYTGEHLFLCEKENIEKIVQMINESL